jgi:hypothetical protein
LVHIYSATDVGGPAASWYEPNEIKQLFGGGQPWTMRDARNLTGLAWSHLGLGS